MSELPYHVKPIVEILDAMQNVLSAARRKLILSTKPDDAWRLAILDFQNDSSREKKKLAAELRKIKAIVEQVELTQRG